MRQYLPGGQRGPWQGGAGVEVPFQRADGTVMSEEEIKRVAQVQQVDAAKFSDNRRPRQALSDEQLEEAWRLTNELGQAEAARRLSMTQAGLQGRLLAYQKRHGLTGPLPGMRTTQGTTASSNGQDRKQPVVAATPVPAPVSETGNQGFPQAPQPVIAIVHHGDPDARAAAFSEGYDQAIADYTPPKAIEALIDWLTENAPQWSQDEAERWIKAFTATIDLVYPTKSAA